jgi:HD-like signal output (HDOD) protein
VDTKQSKLRDRLLGVKVPTMPQVLSQLIELCQSDEASMIELAKLVANDPAMTLKVLSLANSAAYSADGRKVGLLQALNKLGLDVVKTLIISESMFQMLTSFSNVKSSDQSGYWKHALTTAFIARD